MSSMTSTTISASKYIQGPYLASGGQAHITLPRLLTTTTSLLVVTKTYKLHHSLSNSTLAVLKQLHEAGSGRNKCRNLVQILELPTLERNSMVLEYCNGGDLGGLIKMYRRTGRGSRVSEGFVWHVFNGLASAVCYLHTGSSNPRCRNGGILGEAFNGFHYATSDARTWIPIIHRDIKPANILLTLDSSNPSGFPLVKLADFDLSAFCPSHTANPHQNETRDELERFSGGTFRWQPAEQWADPEFPKAKMSGDVWAVGAVVYALCTGFALRRVGEERCEVEEDSGEMWDVGGRDEEVTGESESVEVTRRALPRVVEKVWGRYSVELDLVMGRALERVEERRATAGELVREVNQRARVWLGGTCAKGQEMRQPWSYDKEPEEWQFASMAAVGSGEWPEMKDEIEGIWEDSGVDVGGSRGWEMD